MVVMASANAHRLLMPVVYQEKHVFLELVSVAQPRLVKIYQRELIVTQLTTFVNVRQVSIHVLECRLENFVTRPQMVEMESANAHRLSLLVAYLVKLVFLELVNAEQPRLVRIYQQEHIVTRLTMSANARQV